MLGKQTCRKLSFKFFAEKLELVSSLTRHVLMDRRTSNFSTICLAVIHMF